MQSLPAGEGVAAETASPGSWCAAGVLVLVGERTQARCGGWILGASVGASSTRCVAHACCAVREGTVVLVAGHERRTASVEILGRDSSRAAVGNTFKILPPLSCGPICGTAAVVMDESENDQGQVHLIGGRVESYPLASSAVCKVDLATGDCTAQPALLCPQGHVITDSMAGRLPDGRIVCTGTNCIESFIDESYDEVKMEYDTMAQVLEPPPHGSTSGTSWEWRALG
mmetsp:Transcript_14439/g.35246  ORF Transcript_14439/g.35246 Transcript_14439/m.35246 type:complete len:228 (-) Transcript_14439:72-755(-)